VTARPAAALPIRQPARADLRGVDHLPPRDFLSRAADVGVVVTTPLSAGALLVDLDGYTVTLEGAQLDLLPRQVELLALFLSGPRKVWSREELHWLCWGDTSPSRRVDVQLCRLRAKTGLDLFRNVRDRGWALRPLP
jgi:DNA-binding response OmpR family regulator